MQPKLSEEPIVMRSVGPGSAEPRVVIYMRERDFNALVTMPMRPQNRLARMLGSASAVCILLALWGLVVLLLAGLYNAIF